MDLQRRAALLLALAMSVVAIQVFAQASPPFGREQKQFESLVGLWKLEGTVKAIEATGAADSGPVSYMHVNTFVNDGAILQVRRTGTGPRGPVEELWMYSHNPVTNTYRMDGYTGRGVIRNFTITIKGPIWTFVGTNATTAGVTTRERFTVTYAPDMSSATVRSEHSTDGKLWFERLTGTYTKLSAR